jgi:hypothetical protein
MKLLISSLVFAALLFGEGCQKTKFSETKTVPPVSCSNPSQVKTAQQTLAFPAASGCTWGANGQKNGYASGTREEIQPLTSVPAGSILCSLRVDSQETEFLYDDHFVLALDKAVIAGSAKTMVDLLPKNPQGLPQWDFAAIEGKEHKPFDESAYFCVGTSTCSVPTTDKSGSLTLALADTAMVALATSVTNLQLMLVTIGDNDDKEQDDCEHTSLNLNISVSYASH